MLTFDSSQRAVLDLSTDAHARILGAPGTGKTTLLVESFARASQLPGFGDDSVLVLAPGRLVAAGLRQRIELRAGKPLSGTPVRTASSYAFAVLQHFAASEGKPAPRLLTGTAHDETIESVIDGVLSREGSVRSPAPFAPEVMKSEAFRSELRDFSRVLDDYGLAADSITEMLTDAVSVRDREPVPRDIAQQWRTALQVCEAVQKRLARERPNEFSSSAMIREACAIIRADSGGAVSTGIPRLVLVDDAGDLGEGTLALLAALADRGANVWVFGDPDIATGAYHGERSAALGGLTAELRRRQLLRDRAVLSAPSSDSEVRTEQVVVLDTVYRQGESIRAFVRSLTDRIGAAGVGQQRQARAERADAESGVTDAGSGARAPVQFAIASSPSEELGIIAHRLRAAHLGLDGGRPRPWSKMAVLCRSRREVKRVTRVLASQNVPCGTAAGGVVLREHQLVRELVRLLQHVLGLAPLTAPEVTELLGGSIGGLDRVSVRRLRGALRLQEIRHSATEHRDARFADELVLEGFDFPGEKPILDSRGARRLQKLGSLAAAGAAVHTRGGTPREALWQIWEGSGLAEELQSRALEGRGPEADEAHRALDAVVALFFVLQRHEEQGSEQPVGEVLEELLVSTVPEDSLAMRSERDSVTVTTPQGVVGREFSVVCVLGVQDGAWPNLRSRGSILGVTALERYLRGGAAAAPSRRDTLHDELRLFAHAVSRAQEQVLVLAVRSEDQHPSPFFTLGRNYQVEKALPSTRLTLRGLVAQMRRRLVRDPEDAEALAALAELARAGVPGAHPDDWYGVLPPSTTSPLADIDGDEHAGVPVSPSRVETAETCPLNWFIQHLDRGGSGFQADIGTLVHHALETSAPGATAEELLAAVTAHWGSLTFEAEWQEARALRDTAAMTEAVALYLARFDRQGHELLANEARFTLPIGYARLRGAADRIEMRRTPEGEIELSVVDLKTGRVKPSARDVEEHAQLQAYQLGVLRGSFRGADGEAISPASQSAARLVYVHPAALTKTQESRGERFTEFSQEGLSEAAVQQFEQRILEVARVMAAASFTAQVEHHCEDEHTRGRACALHVIRAVSHG